MIKDGNYSYIDFDSIKPNLVEVFTKYYGEKYRKTIEERINSIDYFPFISTIEVFDYYNQYMDKFVPEIQKEFFKSLDIRPTKKRREALHRGNEGSPLLTAVMCRKNMNEDKLILPETKDVINKERDLVCDAFGISKEDPNKYDKMLKLAKKLEDAYAYIERKHNCDVIGDVNNFQRNLVYLTRDYLLDLEEKGLIELDENDSNIINDPNFSPSDIGNLDANGLLYNGTIETPGSYTAFTSENIVRLQSEDRQVRAAGMLDVLRWMYRYSGYSLDLQQLTAEEIVKELYTYPHSEEALDKIEKEFVYQSERHQDKILSTKVADAIESVRDNCVFKLCDGCKMSESGEDNYYMCPAYEGSNPTKPQSLLYMTESQILGSLESLLCTLMHEVSHCVALTPGVYTKDNKRVVSRCGLFNYVFAVDKNCLIYNREDCEKDELLEILEENANSRMEKKLADIYLSMYPNPFEANDIAYSNKEASGECLYKYWDFMLGKFYKYFEEDIKRHKIDSSYDIYFNGSKAYLSRTEQKVGELLSKAGRIIKPNSFARSGRIDYHKLVRLGAVVKDYQENLLPYIINMPEVTSSEEMFECLRKAGRKDLIRKLWQYRSRAEVIIDEMIADAQKLDEYRAFQKYKKSKQLEKQSSISISNKRDNNDANRNIENFIKSKKNNTINENGKEL